MARRPKPPAPIVDEVLLRSRRRCCLCYFLEENNRVRRGQIAHIDRNPKNNAKENLVFLCLRHHDLYDSKTSLSKGYTTREVRYFRDKLYQLFANGLTLQQGAKPELEEYCESIANTICNQSTNHFYVELDIAVHRVCDLNAPPAIAKSLEFLHTWRTKGFSQVLILAGEYGSGKTWLSLKFICELAKQFKSLPAALHHIPIYVPLRGVKTPRELERVLRSIWAKHGSGSYDLLEREIHKGRVILLLDGFDELPSTFRDGLLSEHFHSLLPTFGNDSKLIVTSRPGYLEALETETQSITIPSSPLHETGLQPKARQRAAVDIVFLQKMSHENVRDYFSARLGSTAGLDLGMKVNQTYNLRDLSQRPILADIIVQTLPRSTQRSVTTASELYSEYTKSWLRRESWRLKDSDFVISFIEELALAMEHRRTLEITNAELISKFNKYFDTSLSASLRRDDLRKKIEGCSFITVDGDGSWEFCHRSFQEFFCARRCFALFSEDLKDNKISFSTASIPGEDWDDSRRQKDIDMFMMPLERINIRDILNILCHVRYTSQLGNIIEDHREAGQFFKQMLFAQKGLVVDFVEYLVQANQTTWAYSFFYLGNSDTEQITKALGDRRRSLLAEAYSDLYQWNAMPRL